MSSRLRFLKEEPEMGAVARARTLARDREFEFPQDFADGGTVRTPTFLVEIDRGKLHGIVRQQRIAAYREVALAGIVPHQMHAYRLVVKR